MPKVKLNGRLAQIAKVKEAEVPGGTVGELVDNLASMYGERFEQYVKRGTVLVNDKNTKDLQGEETRLGPEDVVSVYPLMGGG